MFNRTIRTLAFLSLVGGATLALWAADPAPSTTLPATAPATQRAASVPADQPSPKIRRNGQPDAGFLKRHEAFVELARKGGIDLYFEGDSITDFWQTTGKEVWQKEFAGWKAADFGISGDRTEHVLWRVKNGELEGVSPKVFVLMLGTNNFGNSPDAQIAAGDAAIVKVMQSANPNAKILVLGIFPRGEKPDNWARAHVKAVNAELAKLDDGKNVKYLDIGDKFLEADGSMSKDIMPDFLHPTAKGYEIWAAAIKPVLTEWLGAPATK